MLLTSLLHTYAIRRRLSNPEYLVTDIAVITILVTTKSVQLKMIGSQSKLRIAVDRSGVFVNNEILKQASRQYSVQTVLFQRLPYKQARCECPLV